MSGYNLFIPTISLIIVAVNSEWAASKKALAFT